MGRLLAHKSDEVPVLDCTCTVSQHVANQLGVDLGGSVESNSGLEVVVVHIAIDSGWNEDHSSLALVGLEVLSKIDAVGHVDSGSHKDKAIKAKFVGYLHGPIFLFLGSQTV